MDDMDRNILRALQAEPDLAIAQLGERVGLSQTPCWRRLKRLKASGVIQRLAMVLDPRRLGLSISVLAQLKLHRHDEQTLEEFEAAVLGHGEIVECFSVSGESDYVMRVVAASVDDYERFLKTVLLHLPGVASINSSFMLNVVKMTTDLPI
ncbi:MAG: winged helix-turn-helix transcriptional regulator [Alphaproteobacteria bacterium]|nr:winged helix-turn-helix transcriptional regulator [Alphaproteobacteria bacterium]